MIFMKVCSFLKLTIMYLYICTHTVHGNFACTVHNVNVHSRQCTLYMYTVECTAYIEHVLCTSNV